MDGVGAWLRGCLFRFSCVYQILNAIRPQTKFPPLWLVQNFLWAYRISCFGNPLFLLIFLKQTNDYGFFRSRFLFIIFSTQNPKSRQREQSRR